jgi:hypothetical protein
MGVGKMRNFFSAAGSATSDDDRSAGEQHGHDRPANGWFAGKSALARSTDKSAARSFEAVAPWRRVALAALTLLIATVTGATTSTAKAEITYQLIDGVNAIFITNDIVAGDNARFRKIAHAITGRTAVFLKSNGGALYEALGIGESIRGHGYPTVVAADDTCASSCALIWLGGATRYISPSARIGFHAAYTGDGANIKETSVGNAIVGAYLNEMKLSIDVVMFATSAPPDQIRWLRPDDAKKVGIICIALKDTSKPTVAAPVKHADPSPAPRASAETSPSADMALATSTYLR